MGRQQYRAMKGQHGVCQAENESMSTNDTKSPTPSPPTSLPAVYCLEVLGPAASPTPLGVSPAKRRGAGYCGQGRAGGNGEDGGW